MQLLSNLNCTAILEYNYVLTCDGTNCNSLNMTHKSQQHVEHAHFVQTSKLQAFL